MGFASKLFSAGASHAAKKYSKIVKKINALEPEYQAMSDDEILQRNNELKEKARTGNDEEYVREHACALLREFIKRQDDRRAYDVQILAALALWDGCVIEASTGSGKTLISHFPAYLAALHGKQTHIVTVNEYLTQRDADEDAKIMGPLGFTVGRIYNQQPQDSKRLAYLCNIVYGTPSEFGFDYLRDNMVTSYGQKVQKLHDFVIIDEVDSIIIDEARTPLIISSNPGTPALTYSRYAVAVRNLVPYDEETNVGDYIIDEAQKTIAPTDAGIKKIEERLNGYDIYGDSTGRSANYLSQALKAEYLFHKGKDYIVIDGQVKIVDENTGRVMEGRQWSNGLHQAVEAKEGVKISPESITNATCTLQNYFRMYGKISGMTGTGLTEATEFKETYGIDTVGIPDNKPCIRKDEPDVVYATMADKYDAIVNEIVRAHATGQPILVGTASVTSSEKLSAMLTRKHIDHTVLNAKQHAKEATIVAQAGRYGAVTVATNMAGRGTDIKLGGDPDELAKNIAYDIAQERYQKMTLAERKAMGDKAMDPTPEELTEAKAQAKAICAEERPRVVDAGGLYVIGTERHQSRRIDNQLRGRSGRQGDPGRSVFFVSLEDELMRLFSDNAIMQSIKKTLAGDKFRDDDGNPIPIESKAVSRAIEQAQHKVEQIHYEERKNTLEYDDVINKQRQFVYSERDRVLKGEDIDSKIDDIIYDEVTEVLDKYAPSGKSDKWNMEGMLSWWKRMVGVQATGEPVVDGTNIAYGFDKPVSRKELEPQLRQHLRELYDGQKARVLSMCLYGESDMQDKWWRHFQCQCMLKVIDVNWQKHLNDMEYLRTGIGLRGVGQRDPKVEYKHDAKVAFDMLVDRMYHEYLATVLSPRFKTSVNQASSMPLYQYSQPEDPDTVSDDYSHMPITNGEATPLKSGGLVVNRVQGSHKTYRKADDPNPYVGVGRNDPCPCGSGKKFKYCHGRNL